MIKWFACIVLLLTLTPRLSSAGKIPPRHRDFSPSYHKLHVISFEAIFTDTLLKKTKQQQEDEKKKVKEIAKAKRQAKPEKVDDAVKAKEKPKKQHRPEGLDRPPEIPRRNNN